MKKLFAIIIVAFLCLSLFASLSFAQNIQGKVLHNGKPAAHVLVIISQNRREVARTITGNDGYYFIRNLRQGNYQVRIEYQGGTRTMSIRVAPSGGRFNFNI